MDTVVLEESGRYFRFVTLSFQSFPPPHGHECLLSLAQKKLQVESIWESAGFFVAVDQRRDELNVPTSHRLWSYPPRHTLRFKGLALLHSKPIDCLDILDFLMLSFMDAALFVAFLF